MATTLEAVEYGPFTVGEIPEPLLVRVMRPLRAGGLDPVELFEQAPPFVATVSVLNPALGVTSRTCEIMDPAQLLIDYPLDFASPEQGWVRVAWQDGDFDAAGEYGVQITLDNGIVRLKSTEVWTLSVNDGPASAVT